MFQYVFVDYCKIITLSTRQPRAPIVESQVRTSCRARGELHTIVISTCLDASYGLQAGMIYNYNVNIL